MIIHGLNKASELEPKPLYKYTITIDDEVNVSTTHTFIGTEYFSDDDGYGNFVNDPAVGPRQGEFVIKHTALMWWRAELIKPESEDDAPDEQLGEGDRYDHFLEVVIPQYIPVIAETEGTFGFKTWLIDFAWQLTLNYGWSPVQLEDAITSKLRKVISLFDLGTSPGESAYEFNKGSGHDLKDAAS